MMKTPPLLSATNYSSKENDIVFQASEIIKVEKSFEIQYHQTHSNLSSTTKEEEDYSIFNIALEEIFNTIKLANDSFISFDSVVKSKHVTVRKVFADGVYHSNEIFKCLTDKVIIPCIKEEVTLD